MLHINLLKQTPAIVAGGETFLTRKEVRTGAVLLVVGGAVMFYLASRRTIVVPSAPAAAKTEAISSPPPPPAPAPQTERPAAAPQAEPPAPVAQTPPPAPAPKTEPPPGASQPPPPGAPFQLTEISIQQQKDALILFARVGPGDLKYQTMKLSDPNRLVVDLANCRLAVPPSQYSRSVEHPKVKRVRISQFRPDPPVTRIVLDLVTFPRYQIRPDPQGLEIKVLDGQP